MSFRVCTRCFDFRDFFFSPMFWTGEGPWVCYTPKRQKDPPKPGHPVQTTGASDAGPPGDRNFRAVIFLGLPTVTGHAADHRNPQLTFLAPGTELGPNSSQTGIFHLRHPMIHRTASLRVRSLPNYTIHGDLIKFIDSIIG